MFIFIAVISVQPAYAYIDPATGNILFITVFMILSSIVFIFQFLYMKILLFFGKNCKSITKNHHKFIIFGEGKQYYNVFKGILEEFEKREIPVYYITLDKDDPFLKSTYKYIKTFLEKNPLGYGYVKLSFISADVCLMTTPRLDVLQLKRSKNVKHYSHILHSVGDISLYRKYSVDYFDSILINTEYQKQSIQELENLRNTAKKELKVVGCTYLDELNIQKDKILINKDKFTILIAPSWGQNAIFSKYGCNFIEDLANQDWNIIIRFHPQSIISEKNIINPIIEKYSTYKNISFDYDSNNLKSLKTADIMISDFSGIIYDYAFLFNKPTIFTNEDFNYKYHDINDLKSKEIYDWKILDEIGIKINKQDFKNIVEIIKSVDFNYYEEKIKKYLPIIWEEKGNSAKNVVDFLIKKQKEVEALC